MRFTHSINAVKCIEWDITLNEGALMDLINQSNSWAEPSMVDGKLYYWMSRNKVIDEIPVAYRKADTVYRAFRTLASKGLINYIKDGRRDLVALTEKGKTWNVKGTDIGDSKLGNKSELVGNSEMNPNKLGNKSENNSDSNPTDKNTSINKNINNKNRATQAPDDFSASDKQIEKMVKYGLTEHDQELLVDSFLSNSKSKGLTYKCWTSAFTTWINNEIKFRKLVPIPAQEEYKPAFNGWNDRNPDYKPTSQQPDVYHPSQAEFQSPEPVTYVPAMDDPNWRWTEPLPGMSIIETDRYIKTHKRKGENPNKAYQRLLAEMQGETV